MPRPGWRKDNGGYGKLQKLFEDHRGTWIPLTAILRLGVAQYNSRILDLRRDGYKISNKTEWIDGVRHSWYGYEVPEAKA